MKKRDKYFEIYEFLVKYTTENLNSPTLREITDAIKVKSTGTVWLYLRKLEENNLIEIRGRKIFLKGYKLVRINECDENEDISVGIKAGDAM